MSKLLLARSLLIALSLLLGGPAFSGEVVTITSGGHPSNAKSQAVVHIGQCPVGKYEMHMYRDEKRVQFILQEGRAPFDVSDTTFGRIFLGQPLVGYFLFTCLGSALQVNFRGFDLANEKTPKPVNYFFSIDFNGKIVEDRGLDEEPLESIIGNLEKKLK